MKQKKGKNHLTLRDKEDTRELGRLVAEQDDQLAQYYVAADKYLQRAINVDDPAVFFVGPKGIGKSAILKMVKLQRPTADDRIISISPDDLAFSALANVEATSAILGDAPNNQWVFKTLWDYVLSLEIYRREYPDQNALVGFFTGLVGSSHEKEARKLLKLSEGAAGHSLTGKILDLIKEIELSGEFQGAKVSAKAAIDGTAASTNATQILSLVNSVARRVGDKLRHQYYVLIDDLDLYWNDTPIQNSFIAALFTSLRHFSRPPNIKCVVALRDTIYESLPLDDRDKFHDWVCKVAWDYHSVCEMLEQRIVFKFAAGRSEIWGSMFPANGFDVIWTQSNGRPREAIRLATLAINKADQGGHLAVTDDDLAGAVLEFSKERITECSQEVRYKYPGLEFLIRRMSGWPKHFAYDKLVELAEVISLEVELKEGQASRYPWAAGFAANPKGLAQILLECGVLWSKASRTAEPIPFDSRNPIEMNVDTWFAVHPMFAPALGLIGA